MRRGGQTRRQPVDPMVQVSKAMSFLLRHGAEKERVAISADGGVLMTDLVAWLNRPGRRHGGIAVTRDTVQQVVHQCGKQRFLVYTDDAGRECVRANQGHSLGSVSVPMRRITSPAEAPIAVHGTSAKAWSAILQTGGLSRMTRQHIHFAPGLPASGAVISGMRAASEVVVYLDVAACLADGIELLLSDNNVILSPGLDGVIPLRYIARAVCQTSGQQVYPQGASGDTDAGDQQGTPC